MNWWKRNPETERYYLLPGHGKRAVRRKQIMMLQWALVVGLLVSLLVALAIVKLGGLPR